MKPQGKINKSGLSSESLTVDRHLEGSKLFIRIVCILQLKFDCNQWIQTFWTIHFKPPCNKAHFYAYKRMFKSLSKSLSSLFAGRRASRRTCEVGRKARLWRIFAQLVQLNYLAKSLAITIFQILNFILFIDVV